MTQLFDPSSPVSGEDPPAPSRARLTAWPLWATLAGVAGTIGTVVTDMRPPAETAAWRAGEDYTVTPADIATLEPVLGRVGHVVGLLAIVALLVFAAAWRTRVETHLPRSVAARVVSSGLLITAAALTLGYGWRGALSNYLGPEEGVYDTEGLFVYYMLTDFGAYLPWFGALVSLLAICWMAWRERTVSRVLGTFVGVVAVFLAGAVVVTGVPGLPGTLTPPTLALVGLWLAVGRSRVTRLEVVR